MPSSPFNGHANGHAAQRLRVLVVDDNALNRRVLEAFVKRLGGEPELAEDGAVAVEAYEKEPFPLILMDIQMPGMDGVEAAEEIFRRNAWGERPSIVAVTANDTPDNRLRCERAGFSLFLTKPLRMETLGLAFGTVGEQERERQRT